MKVSYVDHMGSDESVVNAARVSFHKEASQYTEEQNSKLIKYLASHGHWTPFGHTSITLHIKAPIFVARQLGKHQVGFVWNEVSRRYVDSEPEFYVPEVWRKRADNVKQGSSDETIGVTEGDWTCIADEVGQSQGRALEAYQELINMGVAPEQARMVLPQSTFCECHWTGNLYGFANVYNLRTDSHTQKETQEVAHQIGEIIQPLYPVSWEALTNG